MEKLCAGCFTAMLRMFHHIAKLKVPNIDSILIFSAFTFFFGINYQRMPVSHLSALIATCINDYTNLRNNKSSNSNLNHIFCFKLSCYCYSFSLMHFVSYHGRDTLRHSLSFSAAGSLCHHFAQSLLVGGIITITFLMATSSSSSEETLQLIQLPMLIDNMALASSQIYKCKFSGHTETLQTITISFRQNDLSRRISSTDITKTCERLELLTMTRNC